MRQLARADWRSCFAFRCGARADVAHIQVVGRVGPGRTALPVVHGRIVSPGPPRPPLVAALPRAMRMSRPMLIEAQLRA